MKPMEWHNDKLHKHLSVAVDGYGCIEVSYTDGSDSGTASFAPESRSVEKYIDDMRLEIFGNSPMPSNT
jgi:hypothetical protein